MSGVVYSPLCDTNPRLYLAYLCASGRHDRDSGDVGVAPLLDNTESTTESGERAVGDGDADGVGSVVELLSGRRVRCDGGRWRAAVDWWCDGVRGQYAGGIAASVPSTPRGIVGRGGESVDGDGDGAAGHCGAVGKADGVSTDKVVGPRGGVSSGRGPKYERNQASRDRKRAAADERRRVEWKDRGTFGKCGEKVLGELQETRAARLVAENRLREAEAVRKLELLAAQDLDQVKQQQRTRLLRNTEVDKVQIEKAYGSLAGSSTGSVPTMVGGFAETVVSGSISPSSSISEKEVRQMHKDLLDAQALNDKLKKENEKLRCGVHIEGVDGSVDEFGLGPECGYDSFSAGFSYKSGYMNTPEQMEANAKFVREYMEATRNK